MNAVGNSRGEFPYLINDGRIRVYLSGSHFQQNKATVTNKTIINIYCVYELQSIASSRDIHLQFKML